jgi:hypothetical protein
MSSENTYAGVDARLRQPTAPEALLKSRGVPIGCRITPKTGSLFHTASRSGMGSRFNADWRRRFHPQSAPQVVFRERRTRGSTGAAASSAVGRPIDQAGAPRSRLDRRLLEARDTRDMQLRIVDRSAFLFDTAGTVAAVRVHHRLIPLAITYVLPR